MMIIVGLMVVVMMVGFILRGGKGRIADSRIKMVEVIFMRNEVLFGIV